MQTCNLRLEHSPQLTHSAIDTRYLRIYDAQYVQLLHFARRVQRLSGVEWIVCVDQFNVTWELVSDAPRRSREGVLTVPSPFLKGVSNLTEFDDSLKDYVSGSYINSK